MPERIEAGIVDDPGVAVEQSLTGDSQQTDDRVAKLGWGSGSIAVAMAHYVHKANTAA